MKFVFIFIACLLVSCVLDMEHGVITSKSILVSSSGYNCTMCKFRTRWSDFVAPCSKYDIGDSINKYYRLYESEGDSVD